MKLLKAMNQCKGFTLAELLVVLLTFTGSLALINFKVSDYVAYTGDSATAFFDSHLDQIGDSLAPTCVQSFAYEAGQLPPAEGTTEYANKLQTCKNSIVALVGNEKFLLCSEGDGQRECTRRAQDLGYIVFDTNSKRNPIPDFIRNGTVACDPTLHAVCP